MAVITDLLSFMVQARTYHHTQQVFSNGKKRRITNWSFPVQEARLKISIIIIGNRIVNVLNQETRI